MKYKVTIRNILLFFMFALLAVGGFSVWRSFSLKSPEELLKKLPGDIDLALGDVDYTETRGSQRLWRLQADTVARQADSQEVQLEDVRMTLYDQGEYGDIDLTARNGKWFSETGDVELLGDVVIRSDQGQTLFCQQLFYDNSAEVITSESPIRLVAEGMETTGHGLEVFLEQKKMVVPSQVVTRLDNW